eukprot:CAMPEP_0206493966 /NCGR_PEP_ID=MMETSP0324_2-20121206/47389_1 /ASSEMBLY_ACC=CAM_ASM_000836 /TAXON_ID=2866 /ORGANISM="Crypthecodinium cohnii, Strain Seligo" /LENGTH=460 /DNA_ID=CAMNT_0053977415 /DNA_START=87 /DNA_END=1469 /DNA_ORIENTATION=-
MKVAGEMFGKATAHVHSAAESAAHAIPLSEEQKQAAMMQAQWAADVAGSAAVAGKNAVMEKTANVAAQVKEFMEEWLKRKVQTQLERAIGLLPSVIKDVTDDPDMPRTVKKGKDKAIDVMWPDIHEEIMWKVAVILDSDGRVEGDEGPGPDCIRAWLRYHIYPCDKTFWGKIKSPVWMLFTLASLIPWAGMTPLIFLFCFLLIDKTDQFQCISFILQFKGTQFISHGIIRCITGYFLFLNCVSGKGKENEHTCNKNGPGISGSIIVVFTGWILQIVLIWIAFICLRFAKQKGRRVLKGNIQFEHASGGGGFSAGGWLGKLMIYDMVWALMCVGVLCYVVSTRPEQRYDEWVVKHAFYTVQVTYGFSSLPFFIFTLPLIQTVLTHCTPTAYDRKGRCVAVIGPPKPKPERPNRLEMLNMEEAQRLIANLRDIATGMVSGKDAAQRKDAIPTVVHAQPQAEP